MLLISLTTCFEKHCPRTWAPIGQEPYLNHLCVLVLTQGLKHNKCCVASCPTMDSPQLLPAFWVLPPLSHSPTPLPSLQTSIPSSDSLPSVSSAGEIALFWTSSNRSTVQFLQSWCFLFSYFTSWFTSSASCKFLGAETLFYSVCSGPNPQPFSK